jgi:hypothetical protein
MPGKSRRSRGKARSKKRQGTLARVAEQHVVTDMPVTPTVPAPSISVPPPIATPTRARYPYVVTELRRIGILAGIMLAILVVLALVLS